MTLGKIVVLFVTKMSFTRYLNSLDKGETVLFREKRGEGEIWTPFLLKIENSSQRISR